MLTLSVQLDPHVPETAFGKWFLQTETWTVHVLERAIADLLRLIPKQRRRTGESGSGRSPVRSRRDRHRRC
jgi:hypothetical protein